MIGKKVHWIDFRAEKAIPEEALNEIRQLWRDMELDNDHSFVEWYHDDMKEDYPAIARLIEKNYLVDEIVLLHWWW